MMLAYSHLKQIIPALNERALTPADFYNIANAKSIDVCEMKLKKRGYHAFAGGEDFVFIKKTLRGLKWLETAFHELFHAATSCPVDYLHERQQREATALALIALIPLAQLADYAFLEENPTRHAFWLFKERQKVYFLYGV